ncbi:MAG: DsbA family protein [Desulfobacteraceae bacterium]|nr:DsbA family protein [Desulfobacteraceae bacterium]
MKWVAFPLHPETPEQGQGLEELFAGRNIDLDAVRMRLKMAADEVNLPLTVRNMTYNSRKATELGKWAEAQGKGEAYHDALFRAYFADALNIADISVLKQICAKLGLDLLEAETVMGKRLYKNAVDEDWAYALKIGIRAVPTFLINGRMVEGAQSYDILKRLVNRQLL